MTESRDTWTTRDFPVLLAVAEHFDAGGMAVQPHDVDVSLGLDLETVRRAFVALIPTYLEGRVQRAWGGEVVHLSASGLTDDGRRAAGLWPAEGTDRTLALVEAIRAAAEQAETEDERSRLRKAADALGNAAGRITEGAIAAVVAGAVSGGI